MKETRVAIYQWLMGRTVANGGVKKFRLTERFYATKEEVLEFEACAMGATKIVPLRKSKWIVSKRFYSNMIKMFPSNPEYSRQIHHSGGLSGHSFSR